MHASELTLKGACPNTAQAFKAREAADAALAEAEAEHAAAVASLEDARALVADPVRVAREGLEPGEVHKRVRKAEEIEFSASVKVHTRMNELNAARAEQRRCAEGAAELVGERARKRMAAIHARMDAARAEIDAAARDEAALVAVLRGTMLEAFGYDKGVADLGVTVRMAA